MKSVADFRFRDEIPNLKSLIEAWDKETEANIISAVSDVKTQVFVTTAIRLALRHRKLQSVSTAAVAKLSGFSRSTLFRHFPKLDDFFDKSFFLVNSSSVKVYNKYVNQRDIALDEHCEVLMSLWYGAYLAYPANILSTMWEKFNYFDIRTERPYLEDLSIQLMVNLSMSSSTKNLDVNLQELRDVLYMIDNNLVYKLVKSGEDFPSTRHYKYVYDLLYQFLLSCGPKRDKALLL